MRCCCLQSPEFCWILVLLDLLSRSSSILGNALVLLLLDLFLFSSVFCSKTCLCVLFLDLSSCCVPGFVSAFGFLRNFTRSSSTLVSALELQLFALLFYCQRPCAINSLQCYRRTHRWSRFFSTSFCLSTQVLALYNARFRLALC